MGPKMKKVLSSALALMLALVFVAGASEVVEMLGFSPVTAQVLGSDGDPDPTPTPTPTPTPVKKTKKSNPISVKGKTVKLSASKLASKKLTIAKKNALTVSSAKGTVTFKKKSGNSKISINKSSGKITVKKGLKAGTYKLKVTVKASGNSSYKAGSDTATVTIKVVKAKNTLTVKVNTLAYDASAYTETPLEVAAKDAVTVSKEKGSVSYEITEADPVFTVNDSKDSVSAEPGIAAGTYTFKVKVTAAGNAGYKKGSKTVTVTVTINEPAPAA